MKKIFSLILIFAALAATQCDKKPNVVIDTNYYDLPEENEATLSKNLKLNAQNQLTSQSLAPLRDFFERNIVKGKVPFDYQNITNTYFWFVYNALPVFVSEEERHSGYYKDQTGQSFKDRLVAYGIYRIDRSAGNLKKLFALGKPVMKEVISAQTYSRLRIDEKVNRLINTYDGLKEIPDYKEKISDFYSRTYTPQGEMRLDNPQVKEHYGGAYSVSTDVLAEMISKDLNINRYSPLYGSRGLSFWMRRNHEGNAETVYSMLKEIQQAYQ